MERNLADPPPENLYRVFNETDLDNRKGAIADLWDEDGIFIDPDGVHQVLEISAVVTALQRQFPGSVFKGYLPDSGNLGVGRVSGKYGPLGSRHRQRHRRRQDEKWKVISHSTPLID